MDKVSSVVAGVETDICTQLSVVVGLVVVVDFAVVVVVVVDGATKKIYYITHLFIFLIKI